MLFRFMALALVVCALLQPAHAESFRTTVAEADAGKRLTHYQEAFATLLRDMAPANPACTRLYRAYAKAAGEHVEVLHDFEGTASRRTVTLELLADLEMMRLLQHRLELHNAYAWAHRCDPDQLSQIDEQLEALWRKTVVVSNRN